MKTKNNGEIIGLFVRFVFPSSVWATFMLFQLLFPQRHAFFDQMKNHLIVFNQTASSQLEKRSTIFISNLFIVLFFSFGSQKKKAHANARMSQLDSGFPNPVAKWKQKPHTIPNCNLLRSYLDTAGRRHDQVSTIVRYGNWNLCPTRYWSFTRNFPP